LDIGFREDATAHIVVYYEGASPPGGIGYRELEVHWLMEPVDLKEECRNEHRPGDRTVL
jgi:hypothetical protein